MPLMAVQTPAGRGDLRVTPRGLTLKEFLHSSPAWGLHHAPLLPRFHLGTLGGFQEKHPRMELPLGVTLGSPWRVGLGKEILQ